MTFIELIDMLREGRKLTHRGLPCEFIYLDGDYLMTDEDERISWDEVADIYENYSDAYEEWDPDNSSMIDGLITNADLAIKELNEMLESCGVDKRYVLEEAI